MQQKIFTIPPGTPFLKTFAQALMDGRVVENYSRRLGPLELARATIYAPTRRAARALAEELAATLGRSATLLPKILPLGALEETETSLLFEAADPLAPEYCELPPAMGEIARRMQLAELILQWSSALSHAIVRVDRDGRREVDSAESFKVATSAADAWRLSGELAGLIDELIIEEVAWKKLDRLVLPEFDQYWGVTLNFLNIAVEHWPNVLAAHGVVDPARRQAALVAAQSARLREGRIKGPVIAIGSTGTNGATARLLAAVARAPQGAVVLPGLDCDLDARAWRLIAGDGEAKVEASFTHPQAALSRLLKILGIDRAAVETLGEIAPNAAARQKFISEALLPAEATDAWIAYRAKTTAEERASALEGVVLIEAADEREEALCLALAMREILERPGETAALMTPDRALARRVGAELLRWGIRVEDSAGAPLSLRPAGVLARLAISCAAESASAETLAALLAHPHFRLGLAPGEAARLAPLLEIGLLRSSLAAGELKQKIRENPAALIAAAREEAGDRHAHPAARGISAAQWASLDALLKQLGAQLEPLFALSGRQNLATWIAAHRAALEALSSDEEGPPAGEDFDALQELFDELAASATRSMVFDVESYGHFFAAAAQEVVLRGEEDADVHPRLKIYGLLEARLMAADLMLLGGLDETIWPPPARADAFLNRPMRAELKLTPPERKLGQTAHDFTQAMGRQRVILSRAAKRGGAPTVASRFLQRMAALSEGALEACRRRGEAYLALARAIDRPASDRPTSVAAQIKRPMPRPALVLRPERLSVTEIETLRRDPYALYAARVLRLVELAPLCGEGGAAAFGSAVHRALEQFAGLYPNGPLPDDARASLAALLREGLAEAIADPGFRTFRWPAVEKMIDFVLAFETLRRAAAKAIKIEIGGKLAFPLADGSTFTLTARADRIDIAGDGGAILIDYKTGTPPGAKEIEVGFAPQLTLEAAMARRGGFDLGLLPDPVEALYVKLGGAEGGEERPLIFRQKDFATVAEEHFSQLKTLLEQFRNEATPYPSRPFPKYASRFSAYDHLARVKEWSLGDAESGGE